MRVCIVVSILLLAGCVSETRHFRGGDPVRLTVDGSSFDIRLRGNLAEAIRTNPQYAPRLGPLRARAGFAMAQVSGCEVTGVLGDQSVLTGILDCSDATLAPMLPVYGCGDVVMWLESRGPAGFAEYLCSPKY
jgi:hypothetical protein